MAAPKKLTGELARLFQEAFGAVEKRVVPLSEEGAKALQRLSPEQQVAMDELLGQGAKLGEVTGTGAFPSMGPGRLLAGQSGRPYQLTRENLASYPHNQDLEDLGEDALRGQFLHDVRDFPRATSAHHQSWDTRPISLARPSTAGGMAEEDMADGVRSLWASQGRDLPDTAWDQAEVATREAQLSNIAQDANANSVGASWPDAWRKWENIPGVLAGAGAGAAALASRPAQAAQDEEPQLQGAFVPGPVADEWVDVPETVTPPTDDSGDWVDLEVIPPGITATSSTGDLTAQDMGYKAPIEVKPLPEMSYGAPAVQNPYKEMAADPAMQEIGGVLKGSPTAAAEWAAGKFKKHLVDPVIKAAQEPIREAYEKTIAPYERAANPGKALLGETLFKTALGETSFNTEDPEKLAPQAVKGIADLQRTFGDVGAATLQALATEGSNLPFYLINPAGEGAAAGLKGGFLSELVMPGGKPVQGAIAGGVVGAGLDAAIQGSSKLIGKVKQKLDARKVVEPLALVAPDDEAVLAQQVLDLANAPAPEIPVQQVVPGPGTAGASPRATKRKAAAVALGVGQDGKPVAAALHLDGQGLGASPIKPKDIPPETKVVMTAEAWEKIQADPNGDFAFEAFPPPEPTFERGRQIDLQDYDASKLGEVREGSVLVLEGGGGDGTARLYDVKSPKLQRQILQRRGLSEVTLQDGTKVLGYPNAGQHSEKILLPPDPGEMIPRASREVVDLTNAKYRELTVTEIDDVLLERERAILDAADKAAMQEADLAAKQADIKAGGSGNGDKLPPPPPMDPPPPPPPNPHNIMPHEEIKARWWEKIAGTINRKLLNPTVRGAQDVADLAMASHSVDTFERLRDDTFKALNKAVPEISKMPAPQQRLVLMSIDRFVVGDISMEQLQRMHPELSRASYKVLEEQKLQTAIDEQRLRDLAILQPEESIRDLLKLGPEEDLPAYATRMYWRFLMKPGEWKRIASKDEAGMRALVEAIQQDVYNSGKFKSAAYTDADRKTLAERHLDFLLGDPEKMAEAARDPGHVWNQSIGDAGGSTKQRQDLRWWEKAALGEIDNPFIRMAEARSRQKQLVMQGEMWKSVALDQSLSLPPDAPAEAAARGMTVQVPLNPKLYGLSAGRWTTPEVWEALVQAPLAQRNASTFISKMQNVVKYNQTVGNPGSWLTNFMANAQGAMLSNMVNPFASPLKIGQGMHRFAKDYAEHMKAPGIAGDIRRDRFTRGMELGMIGSDYSTAEFRRSSAEWLKLLEKEANLGKGRINPLEMFVSLGRQSKDKLATLYGSIDSLWKYSVWTNGLEKGGIDSVTGEVNAKKAIKFIGARYRPGMTKARLKEQVELEAASRVHYSFPMLDRVGEGVAQANKAIGFVNPYFKVKSELMRNYAQLPRRVLSEPGMKANMMGYAAVFGASYYAFKAMREAMGVSQQEVDSAFASAPSAVQRFKPGAVGLWSRSDQGKLRFIDMTQMFEPLTWMQGDPNSSVATRFLLNTAISPIDGSVFEPEMAELLSAGGFLPEPVRDQKVLEAQKSGARLFAKGLMQLGPGAIRNTYNTAVRGGIGFNPSQSRMGQQETVSPAITATNMLLGPNRIFEAGSRADKDRTIIGARMALDAARKEYRKIAIMAEGQSTGPGTLPLNKAEALKKAQDVVDQRAAELTALEAKLRR